MGSRLGISRVKSAKPRWEKRYCIALTGGISKPLLFSRLLKDVVAVSKTKFKPVLAR